MNIPGKRPMAIVATLALLASAMLIAGCDQAVLDKEYQSRVTAVQGDELTVKQTATDANGEATEETYKVNEETSITRNRKGAKLDDLQPGDYVNVKSETDGDVNVATEIEARSLAAMDHEHSPEGQTEQDGDASVGLIENVDQESIEIVTAEGVRQTAVIDDETTVEVDGDAAIAAELRKGQQASVTARTVDGKRIAVNVVARTLPDDGREGVNIRIGDNVEVQAGKGEAILFRTSKVVGLPVRNKLGDDLGEVEELVVNASTGNIEYAALSFGGFLDIGDKLFAVPWRAFKFQQKDGESHLLFDVTKQELEKAPGFDTGNWPNVADPRWADEIDRFYGVTINSGGEERRFGVEIKGEGEKPAATDDRMHAYRLSKLREFPVRNAQGEDLGKLKDLVVDMNGKEIRYAALSFGGFLGLGDKLFAVPFDRFTIKQNGDETVFILNVEQESLKLAPGFDADNWPDVADPQWSEKIDNYYRMAARPAGDGVAPQAERPQN